jgi:hypothetical protein
MPPLRVTVRRFLTQRRFMRHKLLHPQPHPAV